MKSIAFFNNKGGVGKTTLVYHLAWMFALKKIKVAVIDLDPQSNLTSMFLDDQRLLEIWEKSDGNTILDYITPVKNGLGDIPSLPLEQINDCLGLVPGNLGLSIFEDALSENWSKCLDGDFRAFFVTTVFHRIILQAANKMNADLVLIDVAPSLGAINRAALIASTHVVFPLAPDLFSIQGIKNVGQTRRKWSQDWKNRLNAQPKDYTLPLPKGEMMALGYVVMQFGVRDNRPVQAYDYFLEKIPQAFAENILQQSPDENIGQPDAALLKQLKHYRSLMPLAMKAQKPMFALKPADGAIGAHLEAVKRCFEDFEDLFSQIAKRVKIKIPK
jgi:chromosome partitioning protein